MDRSREETLSTQGNCPSKAKTIDEDAGFIPWWEASEAENDSTFKQDRETLKRILEGSWQLMSDEAKEGYEAQLKKRRRQPAEMAKSQKLPGMSGKDNNNKILEPHVVGGTAPKLPDDNKGNRMLRSMGWSPGEGLGRDRSGRTSPIEVVSRPKLKGLGHGT